MASDADGNAKFGLTSKITVLDRVNWLAFTPLFKAYCYKRRTNFVIDYNKDDYVGAQIVGGSSTSPADLVASYDAKSAELAYDLIWALQNCPVAVNTLSDDAFSGKGREGFLELQRLAFGGNGDSAKAGVLTKLVNFQISNDMASTLVEHRRLTQTVTKMKVTIEDLYKAMLLMAVANSTLGEGAYAATLEMCEPDDIGYDATISKLEAKSFRLNEAAASGAGDDANAFFVGRNAGRQRPYRPQMAPSPRDSPHASVAPVSRRPSLASPSRPCNICGSPDHWQRDCPQAPANPNSKSNSRFDRRSFRAHMASALESFWFGDGDDGVEADEEVVPPSDSLHEHAEEFEQGYLAIGFSAQGIFSWTPLSVPCLGLPWACIFLILAFVCFVFNSAYPVIATSIASSVAWSATANGCNFDFQMYVDSACTQHMVSDRSLFHTYKEKKGGVRVADKRVMDVVGIGTIRAEVLDDTGTLQVITLHDVLHVPSLDVPLFSVRSFRKRDPRTHKVLFDDPEVVVMPSTNGTSLTFPMQLAADMQLHYLRLHGPRSADASSDPVAFLGSPMTRRPPVHVARRGHTTSIDLWHGRLAHLDPRNMHRLSKMSDGMALRDLAHEEGCLCHTCIKARLRRTPRHPIGTIRTTRPLELIHIDGASGFKCASFGKHHGYIIVDDFTRAKFFYGVARKSEALQVLKRFVAQIASALKLTVGDIIIEGYRSDFGGELSAGAVKAWCEDNKISMSHSTPHRPEENGVAESALGVVKDSARCIMYHANWPPEFWLPAMVIACHINLVCPTTALSVTPYELLYGSPPNLSYLRVPGCLVQFKVFSGKQDFLSPRALDGMFIGYCDRSKSYLVYNLQTKRIIRSSDCIFHEDVFPFKTPPSPSPSDLPLVTMVNDPTPIPDPPVAELPPVVAEVLPARPQRQRGAPQLYDPSGPEAWNDTTRRAAPSYPKDSSKGIHSSHFVSLCSMALASSGGEIDDDATAIGPIMGFAFSAIGGNPDGFEPGSYKEARKCSEWDKWWEAIEKEWEAMQRLKVFEYIRRDLVPSVCKIISSKWVFKIKPDKYKARIVIRGFMQTDYGETFAPTVKFVTVRLLFAIAALCGWTVWHMDVKNAFCNAELPDENPVYMEIPEGYERSGFVVRLRKALYGLKNSPRAWFDTLKTFMLSLGFVACYFDACLFIFSDNEQIVLLVCIYVDDCLIAGLPHLRDWFRSKINKEYVMDDLGICERFVGIQVVHVPRGIILHQRDYVHKILKRFGMFECRSSSTPMAAGIELPGCTEDVEEYPYRSVVASLLYLAIATRADIAYTVQQLSRYLNAPGNLAIATAQRCLRYIKGTAQHGILYCNTVQDIIGRYYELTWSPSHVVGFSDADWAGDRLSRRSTSGMIVMFNGTLISWWSRLQRIVAVSTQEAEYVSSSDAARDLMFLRHLLASLNFDTTNTVASPTPLLVDNNAAISLSKNPIDHQRSKHIDIRYHYIRERVANKDIATLYCSTDKQLADVMTKALGPEKHKVNVSGLGIKCHQ